MTFIPLTDEFIELWHQSAVNFPDFSISYSKDEKLQREQILKDYSGKIQPLLKKTDIEKLKAEPQVFFTQFRKLLSRVYNFSDQSLDLILNQHFIEVSKSFFSEARKFDAKLEPDAIYQAMRNMWIMIGLQMLCDRKVELTPAVFAYSLLYPYTDNFLDDPEISTPEKMEFCRRFEQRLRGISVSANSSREERIYSLVSMIETQYHRNDYPMVYESLIEIHNAQVESVKLLKGNERLSDSELLFIAVRKGGASVLADGFLVAGNPTPDQQRFFFGFGVWLQLFDDLQDVNEDLANNVQTLFSSTSNQQVFSEMTNRIVHFGRVVIDYIKYCPSDINNLFSEVIVHSLELMLNQFVGLNGDRYHKKYVSNFEQFSPVGYGFLLKNKKQGTSKRLEIIKKLMMDVSV